MNRFATGGVYPDKVFILQLPKKILEYRLSLKSHDKIEARGVDYLIGIQYSLFMACELIGVEAVIIDASKTIEEIHLEILSNLS